MDSRQLEYFVAVAEELSFTRAAQRVSAVQSTVSAAIKALESDLRTTLFDRSTRSVTLSAAGAAFLPEAKAALDQLERARSVVQEASAGLRGSLRIGTMTSIGAVDLPGLLGAFHRRYPLVDLQVSVSTTGSTGLADDVRHGRKDLALLGLPESDLGGLDVRRVSECPYIALLPVQHRFAGRDGVAIAELVGEGFVDTPRGFGNRLTVDRAFDGIGAPRRVVIEVSDLRQVPEYVRAGLGIAVVPDIDPALPDGLVRIPLLDADFIWLVTLASAAGRRPSRALATLLDLAAGIGEGSPRWDRA